MSKNKVKNFGKIAIAHKLTTSDLGEFGKQFVKSGLVADGAEVALTVEFMKKA